MKNKNALKYEMTDWKQLQIQKQNTKEVISVQKTKLRQELKRQRIGQKRFRKNCMCGHRRAGCSVYRRYNLLQQTFFIPEEQPLVFLCGMKA